MGELLVEWRRRGIRQQRSKFRLGHDYAGSAKFGTGEGVGSTFRKQIKLQIMEIRATHVQEIHMETKVKICISNIATVRDIHDVPQQAIKRRANLAEQLREYTELALFMGGFNVGNSSNE